MAMNAAEAHTMLRPAEESGKSLGLAYYRRAYPKVQRAKQLLEAGFHALAGAEAGLNPNTSVRYTRAGSRKT